jgi:hypothetical protein
MLLDMDTCIDFFLWGAGWRGRNACLINKNKNTFDIEIM